MEYIFITDLHFNSSSNVRTGEFLSDLTSKLSYVVEKSNEWDATILIGGDIFDKPSVPDFVKSELIKTLKLAKHTPWAIYGNHDSLFNNVEKNFKTSLESLS